MKICVLIQKINRWILLDVNRSDTVKSIILKILDNCGLFPSEINQFDLAYFNNYDYYFNKEENISQQQIRQTDTLQLMKKIDIYIQYQIGKHIFLVDIYDTIENIILKIFLRKFYQLCHHKQIKLSFNGKWLENERTLIDYNIQDRSILNLKINYVPGDQFFIKTQNNKIITIDSLLSNTIFDIKEKIEDKEGIPTFQQKLIFNGQMLKNQRNRSYYNICKESTLNLILIDSIQIFIQILSCEIISLNVDEYQDIASLKQQLDISVDKCIFYFAGLQLEDDKTFKDYKIKEGNSILCYNEKKTKWSQNIKQNLDLQEHHFRC